MIEDTPKGLIKYAKQRTQEVIKKLRNVQKLIENEINSNEGIYPYNGGRISQAELCRRAGISQVTLFTPSHRDTTRKMVDEWLLCIKTGLVTGRKSIRRTVTDRAEEWKQQHKAIADNYRVAELEMLEMRRELIKLRAENNALRELLKEAGYDKVRVFPERKKE